MLGGAFDTLVYWHWLALAGVLAGLEIVAPGVFLIFPGIAAAVVGGLLLAMPDLDWRLQILAFALMSGAFIYIGRQVYGRMSVSEDHGDLNRRGDRLVGKVYPLSKPMTGGRGRVRVGDGEWSARLATGGGDHPVGAAMRVVAVEGATLVVTPNSA